MFRTQEEQARSQGVGEHDILQGFSRDFQLSFLGGLKLSPAGLGMATHDSGETVP